MNNILLIKSFYYQEKVKQPHTLKQSTFIIFLIFEKKLVSIALIKSIRFYRSHFDLKRHQLCFFWKKTYVIEI